jgi:hypothetical protein
MISRSIIHIDLHKPNNKLVNVTTLTLGSGPKQGVIRLRAKRKTWESHHMLSGV